MGPIALGLLKTDIPALLKYPILALTTYVGSNLLVYAYTKTFENLTAKSRLKKKFSCPSACLNVRQTSTLGGLGILRLVFRCQPIQNEKTASKVGKNTP